MSSLARTDGVARCPGCACESPAYETTCPRCGRLLHGDELRELQRSAEAAEAQGFAGDALADWRSMARLLPPSSKQALVVAGHIDRLARLPAGERRNKSEPDAPEAARTGWGAKGVGAVGALGFLAWKFKFAVVFLASKAKLLLLGLSKGKTFFSMALSLGVYWTAWGWPFAAGLVGSIYVHEMGHVAALSRLGIKASAPMFIPGFGALIRLKEYPATPREDAEVGLAGPIWGLAAALGCLLVYLATGSAIWGAIAQIGAWINLFNLIPIWQLDGSRGFAAMDRNQRALSTLVLVAAWLVTGDGLLIVLALVAAFRAWQGGAEKPNWAVFGKYAGLVVALSALAALDVPVPGS